MFRRPLRAENPWWDIEDASIWSSSTRWDSKPRGGHSKRRETLDHSYLKARKSYDNRTDSFLWASYFRRWLTIIHFLQRKTIRAEQRLKLEPTAVLSPKSHKLQLEPKITVGEEHVGSDIYCFQLRVCSPNSQKTKYPRPEEPCVFALIIMWFVAVFQKYSLFGSA